MYFEKLIEAADTKTGGDVERKQADLEAQGKSLQERLEKLKGADNTALEKLADQLDRRSPQASVFSGVPQLLHVVQKTPFSFLAICPQHMRWLCFTQASNLFAVRAALHFRER